MPTCPICDTWSKSGNIHRSNCGKPTPCPSCASKDAELTRLRAIAENEKGMLEVIKRDEAELKGLREENERLRRELQMRMDDKSPF